jgi:uncharacterized protein (DUF2236 family)
MTTGIYPPSVRGKLGLKWTRLDEVAFKFAGRTLGLLWNLVPFDRRMHPRARAGWQRSRGQIRADAPLVESPARNLPPESERDSPTHYCPMR